MTNSNFRRAAAVLVAAAFANAQNPYKIDTDGEYHTLKSRNRLVI
jgi:hypothetical protein